MNRFFSEKRGAAAVLITMLFVSLTAALGIIYEASSRYVSENTADAGLENAGRTILSCYDRELQEKYGIFGLEMDEAEIERNAETLLDKTFSAAPMKRSSIESITAESTAYTLDRPDNLKPQITALMKYKIADDVMEMFTDSFSDIVSAMKSRDSLNEMIERQQEAMEAAEEAQRERESGEDDDTESVDFASIRAFHNQLKRTKESAESMEPKSSEDRVLRNRRIKNTLPSVVHGVSGRYAFDGSGTFDYILGGKTGLTSLYENYMTGEYITDYFTMHLDSERTGFFQNEVEYVLYGRMSDNDNYKKAYHTLFAVREALNAGYIYTNEAKKEEALVIANEITPGPWSVLTQQIILLVWSTLETVNDMKNLEAGNGVPVIKSQSTWMVDLTDVINGSISDGYIKIPGNSVMTYENYLKILLMTEDEDVKLYRIMDLIQINMKGSVREGFTMADHFTGVVLNASIKKKSSCPYIGNSIMDFTQVHTYKQAG